MKAQTKNLNGTLLRILSDVTFEIVATDGALYSPYFVPDTSDLGRVEALLLNPEWDELALNEIVEDLNENSEEVQAYRRMEHAKELRYEIRMEAGRE